MEPTRFTRRGRILGRISLGLLAGCLLQAGEPGDDEVSALLALLNTPVTVATGHKQTLDKTPSIISVLRRSEIEAYGARDLSDVLRQVPGFEFGLDLSSTFGLGFRGIWAHEGKALIMINGQAVNDLGFGNFSFFGSIPAAMIERVEIIRGPGSALYGGFAEVAVINVITKRANDDPGIRLSASAQALGGGTFGAGANLSASSAVLGQAGLAVDAGFLRGANATGTWHDYQNTALDLNRDNANREWGHVALDFAVAGWGLRYLQIQQTRDGQDGFYTVVPTRNGQWQETNENRLRNLQLNKSLALSPRWSLDALVERIDSTPINAASNGAALRGNSTSSGAQLARSRGEVTATFTASANANLILGGGYYQDEAQNFRADGTPGLRAFEAVLPGVADPYAFRKTSSARYVLAQYSQALGDFGLTVGGRGEFTPYGNATAPRLALTWSKDKAYAKLLYGQAFRIPLLWQTFRRGYANPAPLEPEKARSYELEGGYRFTDQLFGRVNLFRMDIERPIVFLTTGYVNYGNLHSQGLEGELQLRAGGSGGFLTFSYAKPTGDSSPGFLSQNQGRFLGMAQVKASLGAFTKLGPITVAPSFSYLGPRDAQSPASGLAAIQAGENAAVVNDPAYPIPFLTTPLGAVTLVDLALTYGEVAKGLDIRLKAHNLGGAAYRVVQPYYGGHAPIQANDRQITLELQYKFQP